MSSLAHIVGKPGVEQERIKRAMGACSNCSHWVKRNDAYVESRGLHIVVKIVCKLHDSLRRRHGEGVHGTKEEHICCASNVHDAHDCPKVRAWRAMREKSRQQRR